MAAVMVVCVLIAGCGAGSPTGSARSPTATPTPAPTATPSVAGTPTPTPRPAATPKPQPTDTPQPQAIAGDTLGGTTSAFDQRYGPASDSTDTGYTTTLGGGQADITLDVQPGQDGGDHVDSVGLTPSGGTTWAESGVAGIVASFLPPDARHTQDVQTDHGVEHEYVSRDLAATFPASLFTNDAGTQQVPPGTFFWQCPPASDPSLAATCIVGVGV